MCGFYTPLKDKGKLPGGSSRAGRGGATRTWILPVGIGFLCCPGRCVWSLVGQAVLRLFDLGFVWRIVPRKPGYFTDGVAEIYCCFTS